MRLKTLEVLIRVGLALLIIVLTLLAALCIGGCGHNTGAFMYGTGLSIGVDTQSLKPGIMYFDGFTATDLSRENSGWELEIDSVTGITKSEDGSLKGIKKIRRFVGPQCNGYFKDLAESNPELAKAYMEAVKAFWSSKDAGTRN